MLVGLMLFVAYHGLHPATEGSDQSRRIVLTEDDLYQMSVAWLAQGRPTPTPTQMQSLIDSKVREEILYREALALGLDKDDTIVKRRLAQKMEFLAEDVSALSEPSHQELRTWFDGNSQRFALPPRISFRHLYFSLDLRGEKAQEAAKNALEALGGKPGEALEATALADPFMFQDTYADRSFDQVATSFGPNFARKLVEIKPGSWQGPIASGYGWHLVFVSAFEPSRVPGFEEVETDVKEMWVADQRAEAKRKAWETMRARYQVVLPEKSEN
ncbi:peptidyl-prolyl cis-trans isomerase [Bradyrhizobium sp. McL0616]|uniref:peptidylprolyl isomerase n=1 Tax=Bradyrhizobium sp. McL0616 TaxID=3415674 RepID=UPI003CEA9A98